MSASIVPAEDTIHDSVVTITGGTGSFGSTMAMDLLAKGAGIINTFSRDSAKHDAMRRRIDDPRVRYFIGDVRDAFFHAAPGDLFVRKAPASTVETLVRAVASLWGDEHPEIRVIGSRHGEKLRETLLSREEMVKAEDQGGYFRVPRDARSLQYELFFDKCEARTASLPDYASQNTDRLSAEETKDLLLTIPEPAAQLERSLA